MMDYYLEKQYVPGLHQKHSVFFTMGNGIGRKLSPNVRIAAKRGRLGVLFGKGSGSRHGGIQKDFSREFFMLPHNPG